MNDEKETIRRKSTAGLAAASIVAISVLGVWLLSLSAARSARLDPAGKPSRQVVPIFTDAKPAANSPGLVLHVDRRKVLGWISGNENFTGAEVRVQVNARTETVIVQGDNTFTWYYSAAKGTDATFSVGKWSRAVRLMQPDELQPSVFFVVDRTAYRPGQTLHFVGFLRKLNAANRFEPLPREQVEVAIRSAQKKTVAAKLKLESDEFGRVIGSYTFMRQDALDDYTLVIAGY